MSVFERLLSLFVEMSEEEIDTSSITPDTRLVEDIGFSSYNLIWMAFAIHNEFGIDINSMQDWMPVTVKDICDKIEQEISK